MALTLSPAALAKWRWYDGMQVIGYLSPLHPTMRYRIDDGYQPMPEERAMPDLSDRVTVASLALVVREVWGDPTAFARSNSPLLTGDLGWCVVLSCRGRPHLFDAPNEPEAWIAALEAAP